MIGSGALSSWWEAGLPPTVASQTELHKPHPTPKGLGPGACLGVHVCPFLTPVSGWTLWNPAEQQLRDSVCVPDGDTAPGQRQLSPGLERDKHGRHWPEEGRSSSPWAPIHSHRAGFQVLYFLNSQSAVSFARSSTTAL